MCGKFCKNLYSTLIRTVLIINYIVKASFYILGIKVKKSRALFFIKQILESLNSLEHLNQNTSARRRRISYFLKRLHEYERGLENENNVNLFINQIIKKLKLLNKHLIKMREQTATSKKKLKEIFKQIIVFEENFDIYALDDNLWNNVSCDYLSLKKVYYISKNKIKNLATSIDFTISKFI
ncbi:hypothetical protein CDIK_3168 [Cucumispora dikerogammari]|nr:hypothetical protein CDIK_3168 [Cucumispora dikerogammari]